MSAVSAKQVTEIVHDVLVEAFKRDRADPEDAYAELGRELWQACIDAGLKRGRDGNR